MMGKLNGGGVWRKFWLGRASSEPGRNKAGGRQNSEPGTLLGCMFVGQGRSEGEQGHPRPMQ